MKILIIDDEARIVRGVQRYFEQAGFEVVAAYDGPNGLTVARQAQPDLIVLDLMLPGMDGLDVCRTLRRESEVPIIMLTARVEEADKLIGLELGADDYVTKPFSPRELVARARAVLRRSNNTHSPTPAKSNTYRFGEVIFDVDARHCIIDATQISLTPTEYDLLLTLVQHPGRTYTREQLLATTNLGFFEGVERTVDVHIHNLRKKLEPNPAKPRYILTVFGVGYRFTGEVEKQ